MKPGSQDKAELRLLLPQHEFCGMVMRGSLLLEPFQATSSGSFPVEREEPSALRSAFQPVPVQP